MFHGIWWVLSVYKIKIKSCIKYVNLKIQQQKISKLRLKGKKLKDEKMKDLHSHGGQVKSQWNSLRLRRGKIKKKKECNSLAKMFVFFFSCCRYCPQNITKTQANVGQTNSDKNNLNNNLEFGKVNTISKLQIQDTP